MKMKIETKFPKTCFLLIFQKHWNK